MQCCTCSKWVHLRCSQLSLSKFGTLGSFHSWSYPRCCVPTRNTVTSSSDSSDMYTSTVQSSPSSANAALSPPLVFKLLILRLPILYLLPLLPHHRPLLLAVFLRLLSPLPPDSLRVLQWNAGGLPAQSTSPFFVPSCFRIPGFSALRSNRTHSRSGILSRDATHASGGFINFVRQGLSFSELSTSSLSSLDPYSDYVGINISLNNSSSLSFLNVYAHLFAPLRRKAEPIPSPPPFFPLPEISSFWKTSTAITPSGTQEVLPTPAGRKYSTGLSLLTSSPSLTLKHSPFYIAPLAVAPSLIFLLLPPLWPFSAPGRCFKTWILITNLFFYLSLSLSGLSPQRASSFLNFQKARWDDFVSYFDSHCPSGQEKETSKRQRKEKETSILLQRNTRLFLFSLLLLSFTSLALNAAKSPIPFGRIKRHSKAWWSAEVEDGVSERRKAFAAAHRSDEDRQAYISASRRASSAIAKAKAEAWQTTCSSLSPKLNPKTV